MKMRTTKVLIADDDAGMLGLLARVLDALDVEVIEARDAMSALVLANETAPDMIILDISMPGGNGLSACEMLASMPALTHVPVVILTGKSDDATLFRCQNIGAHYICKGADAMDEVRSTVRRLLGVGGEVSAASPELFVG
jgi:two-component system, cell cycle response regulator